MTIGADATHVLSQGSSATANATSMRIARLVELGVKLLARLPLRLRRPVLRLAWRLSLPFREDVGFGAGALVSASLGVRPCEGERIARDLDFEDCLQAMEWLAGTLNSLAAMRRDWRHTSVEDPETLTRLAATGDPVVLAPVHMGSYALGLACLLHRFFPGRRVLILRAREDNPVDRAAVARLGEIAGELRILNIDNRGDYLDAMRFARQGAVVICFADLPASYGAPAEVSLFGAPARIAFGLDAMARMLTAEVLPIAVRSTLSGDFVRCGRPFAVSHRAERSALAAVVAADIERFILENPAQWHMWTRLGEFRQSLGSSDLIKSELQEMQ